MAGNKPKAASDSKSKTTAENKRTSYRTLRPWMIFGSAAAAAAVFLVLLAGPLRSSLLPAQKNTITGGGNSDNWDSVIAAETTAEITEYANLENSVEKKAEKQPENSKAATGILHYSQLNLMSYRSLTLPDQAVTLPEDTMYFSEDILEDTELLCLGTVTSISVETDPSQDVSSLVYDICLENICYSSDYITEFEHITVKSPVVGAEGGENQILYQLQAGATYLLPLKRQTESWELLFPFAPQIQVTGDGSYLFHSGYASLTNDSTWVVIGEQEGANDFYYDRMLLREDEDFLSDYIALVMKYTGGEL